MEAILLVQICFFFLGVAAFPVEDICNVCDCASQEIVCTGLSGGELTALFNQQRSPIEIKSVLFEQITWASADRLSCSTFRLVQHISFGDANCDTAVSVLSCEFLRSRISCTASSTITSTSTYPTSTTQKRLPPKIKITKTSTSTSTTTAPGNDSEFSTTTMNITTFSTEGPSDSPGVKSAVVCGILALALILLCCLWCLLRKWCCKAATNEPEVIELSDVVYEAPRMAGDDQASSSSSSSDIFESGLESLRRSPRLSAKVAIKGGAASLQGSSLVVKNRGKKIT